MKPSDRSLNLLSVTRSKGKMFEYSVPIVDHIAISRNPAHLFPISIGLLGDVAAEMNRPHVNQDGLKEKIRELRFSAQFFDSYIQSRLNETFDQYFLILASSAYYLCDLPGSSSVLLSHLRISEEDFDPSGIGNFLVWLLRGDYVSDINFPPGQFRAELITLKTVFQRYFTSNEVSNGSEELIAKLRNKVYEHGTPRELILTDVACSILRLKLKNSARALLPEFSGIAVALWEPVLRKKSFVKELWPSQKILGRDGVFRGDSAVIQMPTSAGKSKSVEVIIRSAFLSGRAKTCVVVAPFRALCHEITESLRKAFENEEVNVNELSDVFQKDFDADELVNEQNHQVLSVTPEKLVYVLRQSPELASQIGLLILDEGHQFDSGIRGVTYELLITNLKKLVPENVQTVLISAVISNADAISDWLLGTRGKVVRDSGLSPAFRTVGFSTWTTAQGRIQYVKSDNILQEEFWVPRVIESQVLNRRGKETKERIFPDRSDGGSVAAHLGIKLVKNGGVAIFCGVKATASTLTWKIIDAFERGYGLPKPSEFADEQELRRLAFLYEKNFGASSGECLGAKIGLLSHHAGIPQGIRSATEYSLREGLAKFIVCTSTLAQGVNLPIRYLIFTNIYMAGEKLRVRDFHNLIGRAGRSGMQTEGTILFADPEVYDKRMSRKEQWRFKSVQELFDSAKSEPCASSLLKIFDPLKSKDGKITLDGHDVLETLKNFYDNEASLDTLIGVIVRAVGENGFDEKSLRRQLKHRLKIAGSVEGYLISALEGISGDERIAYCSDLAKSTLAYHLASSEQKENLIKLFLLICSNVDIKITSDDKKIIYSRTLLGVAELIEIDQWIQDNEFSIIMASGNDDDLFDVLYPILERFVEEDVLKKIVPIEARSEVAKQWISGVPFVEIENYLVATGAKLQAASRSRKINIHHVVDICEGELAFDGMLILGAIAEVIEGQPDYADTTIPDSIRALQKRIKYGLPNELSVRIYELGFSERVVAQKLAEALGGVAIHNRYMLVQAIKDYENVLREILNEYPAYFMNVIDQYVD